ncbi:PREDICTED: centromere protein V-like [Priapulus caudatus]|uniref:Centromere protein V-like n=1 Tax=Priapulus caudatus TaxID=37621 RepID=A0ABM1E9L8_PRICU|nr:PREDICTED: centromere protein V-like [Priapulus caudatus]XP_014668890.1 PREDICTED: centromere protein V-like [Priapulus caudatus]XP_014668891.1 PREDICTED: centromere protein V-like [Priapulus caudatus]XP_014668892.1 PREDICTED: centromere protein V-like [Priapulus caudatus]XP_014668893.1 PREDICTED: centromere protein V-like [Priapulus caudatus]
MADDGDVLHTGGCHCGAVRFEVWAPPTLRAIRCNCSVCTKKQNWHFVVAARKFRLLAGEASLHEYRFGTRAARHTFCGVCGVQSFYTPRSNPDGRGIAPHCLDPGTVVAVTWELFDGRRWEQAMRERPELRERSRDGPKVEERSAGGLKVEERSEGGPEVEERSEGCPEVEERSTGGPEIEERSAGSLEVEERSEGGPEAEERSEGSPEVEESSVDGPDIKERSTGGSEV